MSGTEEQLKRLGFVKTYASQGLALGESIYKKARGFVPASFEAQASQIEDSAVAFAAPLVARANDKVAEVLSVVDSKVDTLYGTVASTLDFSRDLHSKNMASFSSAKESAYGLVEGYVNATKAALDPQRYVDYATGVGKTVVDTVVAYSDPDKLVALAADAYDRFTAHGPVLKVLGLVDPLITLGQSQYTKAHDIVVVNPLYKKLYEAALALPSKAKDAPFYPLLVSKGYPLVAPVADPVISNFTKSKVIKQIDEHLKPKTA